MMAWSRATIPALLVRLLLSGPVCFKSGQLNNSAASAHFAAVRKQSVLRARAEKAWSDDEQQLQQCLNPVAIEPADQGLMR